MKRSFPSILLAVTLSGALPATPDALQELVANSPFGNAAGSAASPDAAAGALEFRGMFSDGGEYFFSLFDPASRRSTWVGLNESGHPFVVKAYDANQGTIAVEVQGRSLVIPLKQATVVAVPAAPVAGSPAGNASAGPLVAPKPATDEATRLAQIAEEIRRRRALRVQAMQKQGPPAPPANSPPPSRPATP
jgi:hypothetical protein